MKTFGAEENFLSPKKYEKTGWCWRKFSEFESAFCKKFSAGENFVIQKSSVKNFVLGKTFEVGEDIQNLMFEKVSKLKN